MNTNNEFPNNLPVWLCVLIAFIGLVGLLLLVHVQFAIIAAPGVLG